MGFWTGSNSGVSEKLRITSAGNIGISQAAPTSRLHVNGGNIRVDSGTTGSDGLLGQAYGGYFGLKHTDQTLNSEYMIISNDTNTFVSCTTGYSVYIRPNGNDSAHELIVASSITHTKGCFAAGTVVIDPDSYGAYSGGFGNINDGSGWGARGLWVHGGGTGDAAAIAHNGSSLYFGIQDGTANSMYTYARVDPAATGNIQIEKNIDMANNTVIRRSQYNSGFLEGGHNNIGSSNNYTNPIFTIGASYKPNATTLGNMYGIGYCANSASFINSNVTGGWGLYAASDGDARIFLNAGDGRIFADQAYGRTSHQRGFLEGGHNNIGSTSAKTSPIYCIGSSYTPNEEDLNNMYGIGFCTGGASFLSGGGWGMYVASDGDARLFLDATNGNFLFNGGSGAVHFNNGTWSGDQANGKIQTHAGHMYLQNAGNTSSWAFRLPNATEPYVINYQGTVSGSDVRRKKDITTITGAVDTIKQLIGRSFTWREADTKGFGVIAQEVEKVLPDLVTTQTVLEGEENDDPYKMMNYAALSGHFIEAIKELATKIETLEQENTTLKARVTTLEG